MAVNNSINEAMDVQTFTSTGAGTWTKPNGAKFVLVVCVGGGGGGGGGSSTASGTARHGGGGGGGASITKKFISASDLGTTESVSVGTGGTGGTGGRGEVRVYSW